MISTMTAISLHRATSLAAEPNALTKSYGNGEPSAFDLVTCCETSTGSRSWISLMMPQHSTRIPFEPQPDGVDTIFPVLDELQRATTRGYIELPYTMVQDSTLFLLLRESGIDLWKRKLDWIARHGGMVLLNVHPDYIDFAEGNEALRYPIARYRELLEYIRDCYGDLAWHALPRDVAAYCAAFRPQHPYSSRGELLVIQRRTHEQRLRTALLSSLLWAIAQ